MITTNVDISLQLRREGVRPSVTRVAVVKYLMEHHNHPTVDELYAHLVEQYPGLSRTTVYNTVHTLVDSRVLTTIEGSPEGMRVDLACNPHAHFVCDVCGAVADIAMELPEPPEQLSVTRTQLVFRGVCCNCKSIDKEKIN